jgi:RNA polymerase sigma-70 factor (ECF subfamily)
VLADALQATDQDLVLLFAQGDSAAFEEVVRRHEQRIYNLSLRMLGRPEDARDATQETFLAALRKLPSFRGDSSLGTWLHRVAVNACYDILRRRKRRAEEGLPEDPGAAPGDLAESSAEAVDVQRALAQVPEEFRAVLVLHDVQDLPYDEIAEILGVPVGTVKSRVHRGRVGLARLLPGTDGSPGASDGKMEA